MPEAVPEKLEHKCDCGRVIHFLMPQSIGCTATCYCGTSWKMNVMGSPTRIIKR